MNSTKTILIIEDNCEALQLYGEILRSENFQVIEAAHGKAALECLSEQELLPDLIIMDLTFPYMTAEEFVASLRSDESWQSIPLLVISGHVDTEERSIALKASGFLKKPFDLENLFSAINRIINIRPDHHEASG